MNEEVVGMYIFLCVCVNAHIPGEAIRGCEVSRSWFLGLQVIVSFSLWVLGTKLGSSARAVHVLPHLSSPFLWLLETVLARCNCHSYNYSI